MALDYISAMAAEITITCGEPLDAALCAKRFLADLDRKQGEFAAMFWEGGPGGATTRALRSLQRGAAPAINGHPDDGGNGAAMRAHPVGCLGNRETVLRVAAMQAKVTHGHPAAVAAAQAVAVLVYDGIAGVPASADVPQGVDDPVFAAAWRKAHRDLVRGERLPAHLRNVAMSGWETIAAAHAISLLYDLGNRGGQERHPRDAVTKASTVGSGAGFISSESTFVSSRITRQSQAVHASALV